MFDYISLNLKVQQRIALFVCLVKKEQRLQKTIILLVVLQLT